MIDFSKLNVEHTEHGFVKATIGDEYNCFQVEFDPEMDIEEAIDSLIDQATLYAKYKLTILAYKLQKNG